MAILSRFNPTSGIVDFWHEFRKPNPLRYPILLASMAPFGVIFYWLGSETVYKDPDRPSITYITTFDPTRSDEEIIATNIENQEVKELREEQADRLAQRKRDLYKALGAAAGMDVERIAAEADARRAAEEAAEAEARAERLGRSTDSAGEDNAEPAAPEEPAP
ncbi:hypothetical protein [Erythrobacter rubeus]|uniref:Uncharacterized protein n=1 Tax=Erythrobacter rubeus TaxID=2760803 RepID=A0ABR8KX69_9SPHN|nr:hypothetical protein [Erythrobacter rubeus]MBD2842801.1 hypothetical protein [Erythrobacter rubeus]